MDWAEHCCLCILLAVLVFAIMQRERSGHQRSTMIDAKAVGISLFGPYLLVVELASMLLLAGLVVAFHIGP
jgi:NADH-quinone oxidoreductase subunit J